jgi:peptidoglycan/LPS O-acetylase OafA/YrhL
MASEYHLLITLEGLCWTLILLLLLGSDPFGRNLLVNPFFAFSGKISYSLYLVHLPVIFFMMYPVTASLEPSDLARDPAVYAWAVLTAALSVLLSVIAYRLVEVPFLRLKERLPVFSKSEKLSEEGVT